MAHHSYIHTGDCHIMQTKSNLLILYLIGILIHNPKKAVFPDPLVYYVWEKYSYLLFPRIQVRHGLTPTFAALVYVFEGFLQFASCCKFAFTPDDFFCIFL